MDQSESNITPTKTPDTSRPSIFRRIYRFVTTSIVVLLLALILISAGAFMFSQTQWFRDIVRDRILVITDDALAADLDFTRLGGNFLTGLTLDSLTLTTSGDTLLFSPQVSFRYDLSALLDKRIYVDRVRIKHARINLLRSPIDSSWNYENIMPPSAEPPDTSEVSEPFGWKITLGSIVLDGARLQRRDLPDAPPVTEEELALAARPDLVRFSNLDARNFNMAFSAELDPDAGDFSLQLSHLNFLEANSGFRVRDLSGNFHVDRDNANVDDLRVYTDDSHLYVSAELLDVDLLGGVPMEQWKSQPASIRIDADSVATQDLHRFLPDLAFLNNSVGLVLEASGTYGDLNIAELDLQMRESRVRMEGRLRNLHTPENLFIDARMDRTQLSYRDVVDHVPGLDIPDLNFLGVVRINDAVFHGYPQDFQGTIDVATALGKFTADGKLDVSGPEIVYDVRVRSQEANLAAWLQDQTMDSHLNADIVLAGRGVDLQTMKADFRVESQNSRLAGYRYAYLLARGSIGSQATVTLDSLTMRWPRAQFAPRDSDLPQVSGQGWLRLQQIENPAYNMAFDLRNLNLEEFFPGDTLPSAISGAMSINGIGYHPDSLDLSLSADMQKLEIPGDTLPPLEFQAQLTRRNADERSLLIESPIARVRLEGRYRFDAVAASLNSVVDGVVQVIEEKYNTINSVVNDSTSMSFEMGEEVVQTESEPIQADLYLRVLDISPLRLFDQSDRRLDADLQLRGSISGHTDDFLLKLDSGSVISRLELRDSTTALRVPPSRLGARFRHQRTDFDFAVLTGDFSFDSDSTVLLNDITLNEPHVALNYGNETLVFDVSTGVLDDYHVRTRGSFDISGLDEYAIALDSLQFDYRDSLTWLTENRIEANLTSSGVRLDSVRLYRPGAEKIQLSGLISLEDFNNTAITVENFTISDINKFLAPEANNRIEVLDEIEGEIDSLYVGLNGTWASPIIELDMRADSLKFAGDYVGDNFLKMNYRDTSMTGTLEVLKTEDDKRSRVLLLSIDKLPVYLGLAERAKDAPLLAPNREVSISLLADSISLGSIGLFVPSIDKIYGYAHANFLVNGYSPNNLSYYGHVDILNSQLRVVSTNMLYGARGSITLNDDLLHIDSLMVINHPTDLRGTVDQRKATVSGDVRLDGFDIDNFDVKIETDRFMVMNEGSRATSPDMYGNLVIATRNQPLRLQGNMLRPKLTGAIEVLEGDISLPLTRKQTKVRRTFCFERIERRDGSIIVTERDCNDSLYNSPGNVVVADGPLFSPGANGRKTVEEDLAFPDRIIYDVRVWLRRDVTITMELGPFEELTAVVNLENPSSPLRYKSVGWENDIVDKVEHLLGTLDLKDGSKYDFYRSFKSVGKVTFDGPIISPKVDITATIEKQRRVDNGTQDYKVEITLKGTLEQLQVEFRYWLDGELGRGTSDQITSNALSLIVFGKTLEELQGTASGLSATNNFTGSVTNKLASDVLGEFLQDLGFIESVEVQFGEAQGTNQLDFSQARVRITGKIFDTGLGYHVDSDLGESGVATVTVDVPMSILFTDVGLLRDLLLSASHTTGAANNSNRRNKEWEFKLGVRRSF